MNRIMRFARWFFAFVISMALIGCNSGGDNFLGKDINSDKERVTDLTLVVAPDELPVGAIDQGFVLIARYSNGTHVNVTSVADWSSDAEDVVTVNGGLIGAHKVGTANIDASFEGGSLSDKGNEHQLTIVDSQSGTGYYTVSPNYISLNIDSNEQLRVSMVDTTTGTPIITNVPNSRLSWESNNENIVEVDDKGFVKAKSEGRTTIKVTIDNTTEINVPVNITDAVVMGLSVSPPTVSVAQGGVQQMSAHAIYDNGFPQDITRSVEWSVADETVATVNPDTGLLTGVLKNSVNTTTTVTATWTDAASRVHTRNVNVTVTEAELVNVIVSTPSALLLKQVEAITATAIYATGAILDVSGLAEWQVRDEGVLYIIKDESSNQASVAAIDYGGTTVSASYGGVTSDEVAVKVVEVTALEIRPLSQVDSGKSNLAKGTALGLAAYVQYDNVSEWVRLRDNILWESSDDSVLSVDGFGLVTAEAIGSGQSIKVTDLVNGVEASYSLEVTGAEPVSMVIDLPNNGVIGAATSTQLNVIYTMTDGNTQTASLSDITWSEDSNDINASITKSGSNGGMLNSLLEGWVTITAESSHSTQYLVDNVVAARVEIVPSVVIFGAPVSSHVEGDHSETHRVDLVNFQLLGATSPDVAHFQELNLESDFNVKFQDNNDGTYTMSATMPPRRLTHAFNWVVNTGGGTSSVDGIVTVEQSSFVLESDGSLRVNGKSIGDGHTLIDGSEVILTRTSTSDSFQRTDNGECNNRKNLYTDTLELRGVKLAERKDSWLSWDDRSYNLAGGLRKKASETYETKWLLEDQVSVAPGTYKYTWVGNTRTAKRYSLECTTSPMHEAYTVKNHIVEVATRIINYDGLRPKTTQTNEAGVYISDNNTKALGAERSLRRGAAITGALNFF